MFDVLLEGFSICSVSEDTVVSRKAHCTMLYSVWEVVYVDKKHSYVKKLLGVTTNANGDGLVYFPCNFFQADCAWCCFKRFQFLKWYRTKNVMEDEV